MRERPPEDDRPAFSRRNDLKEKEGGIPRKRLDNANLIGTPPKVPIKPLASLCVKRRNLLTKIERLLGCLV